MVFNGQRTRKGSAFLSVLLWWKVRRNRRVLRRNSTEGVKEKAGIFSSSGEIVASERKRQKEHSGEKSE